MKKIVLLLAMIMLFFTIYIIRDTYALYESNKNYDVESDIARWIIKVNDLSLKDSSEFTIDKIIYEKSESTLENKISPGMCGYFDIDIDASNSDVSVRYNIKFDKENLKENNIVVKSIKELNDFDLTLSGDDIYTGLITLASDNKVHTIRTTVCWDDNEELNDRDSENGSKPNNKISIPIVVNLTQYLGEEIPVYVKQ